MKNNTLKKIFDKEIEFKFKLADLFAIQFDSYGDGVNCETFAYVEEIQNAIKKETISTITNRIIEELKEDTAVIKEIIRKEVKKYRENGELIIKNEAKQSLTIEMSKLKSDILKEIKEDLVSDILEKWNVKNKCREIKEEILKQLEEKKDI